MKPNSFSGIFLSHQVGFVDGGLQSTVDELSCGVVSCLPFIRSVLQNQLLQSAKILNEVSAYRIAITVVNTLLKITCILEVS